MKHRFGKIVVTGLMLAGVMCVARTSLADTIQGSVWENATGYPSTTFTAPPSGPADITFNLSNPSNPFLFNFYSSTDGDLTNFLTNSAMGPNGDSVTYTNGSTDQGSTTTICPTGTKGSCGINNDVMEFTGKTLLTNGQTYSFTHDDGMFLNIGDQQVISSGGPTSAATSSFMWSGPTGVDSYSLYYAEVNGAPAVLSSPDFGLTPEPSSLLLLGTGLAGLAFLLFRKRDQSSGSFAA